MNGELLLQGYKFSEKLILNLQDKTVLTGEDTFTVFEIFNMLENYFNRKDFSDYYLDQGTILILNGNKLSGAEFAVFRLRPVLNLSEELKISKRSILGQAMQAIFSDDDKMPAIMAALQADVISRLNAITEGYGVSFVCEKDDILTLAKILLPVVKEKSGQEILQQEQDQFHCKAMLLDFIVRLKTNKKKLLLVELPEYGLQEGETTEFLKLLSAAPIDNVIIYTCKMDIYKVIPQVFNYNAIKNGRLYGFDDYDELEKQLQDVCNGSSADEIEQKVMEYIFQPKNNRYGKAEFERIVDGFFDY